MSMSISMSMSMSIRIRVRVCWMFAFIFCNCPSCQNSLAMGVAWVACIQLYAVNSNIFLSSSFFFSPFLSLSLSLIQKLHMACECVESN